MVIGLPFGNSSTKLFLEQNAVSGAPSKTGRARCQEMPSSRKKDFYTNDNTVTAERRGNLRFPFTASVEAIEPKSGTRIQGRSTDLGLGGCYVDSLNPYAVGTVVKIRITKDRESFETKAMVTFSQVGMGMGLSFIASEPQQSQIFQRWVTELSGSESAPPVANEPAFTAVESAKEASHGEAPGDDRLYVLNELVIALMRKGVLSEGDGKEMLRKLHR
jgi:hypothetical protein